jgi:ubiquitin-conjugating enzyme E2 T
MAAPRGMHALRMVRELQLLSSAPPPGVAAWPRDDERLDVLDAEITGAAETPYADGVFRLRVNIPPEYPLKPPGVRFITKIYHPNIDAQGRICLDTLNMPPKGAWKPSLNVITVLASIQLLMSHPNPDDGLMADITDEFKRFPDRFHATALEWTRKYAKGTSTSASEPPTDATGSGALSSGDVVPSSLAHGHGDVETANAAETPGPLSDDLSPRVVSNSGDQVVVGSSGAPCQQLSESLAGPSTARVVLDGAQDAILYESANKPETPVVTSPLRRLRKRSAVVDYPADYDDYVEPSIITVPVAHAERSSGPEDCADTLSYPSTDRPRRGSDMRQSKSTKTTSQRGVSPVGKSRFLRATQERLPKVDIIDLEDPVVEEEKAPSKLTRLKRRRV